MLKCEEKARGTGNFVGFNKGIIINCYSVIKGRKEIGFVGTNKGKIFSSYGKPNEAEGIEFDKRIWQRNNSKRCPYKFIPHFWTSNIAKTVPNSIKISNAKQLLRFAKKINSGDIKAQNSTVELTKNINLLGKKWETIGKLKSAPFNGDFNGNGHKIYNLHIKGNKTESAAFWGFNKGTICNLIVDLRLSQGTAGFVANNRGIIETCGVVVGISNNNKTAGEILGGFVGENYGEISRCYAAGKVHSFAIPAWVKAFPIIALVALPVVFPNQVPYKKIPYDKSQVVFEEKEPAKGNFVSFQFNMQATIERKKGTCQIDYINTGDSNKDVVLEVQITDRDCYNATGTLDKSPEELQELIDNGNYDPDNSWTTIAKSNAIRPGNALESAKITKLYGGKYLPPGAYEGRAHLIYYDIRTHNRAVVDNSFAIMIEVI